MNTDGDDTMYELWLTLNIVWELARAAAPLVLAALGLWLAVIGTAAFRRARWRQALAPAAGLALLAALGVFATLPSLTRSSFGELRYWVDWANLAAIAVAGGAIMLAYAWPLLALRGTACPWKKQS